VQRLCYYKKIIEITFLKSLIINEFNAEKRFQEKKIK
jgi:hypothetical protein